MSKLCNYCNKYPIFGGGYCKYHQYLRTDIKKTIKTSNKPIKKTSNKRKEQMEDYMLIKEEVLLEAKLKGKYKCFFCNKEFDKNYVPDIHHLNERENEQLKNKKYLCLAHRSCHTLYHSLSVDKIEKYDWYNDFLDRLKKVDEKLYNKEIYKKEKL